MIEESFFENENDDFAESLLEDITVLQKLGVGAFSKVYKVEYKNQIYALKVLDIYKRLLISILVITLWTNYTRKHKY